MSDLADAILSETAWALHAMFRRANIVTGSMAKTWRYYFAVDGKWGLSVRLSGQYEPVSGHSGNRWEDEFIVEWWSMVNPMSTHVQVLDLADPNYIEKAFEFVANSMGLR